MPAQTNTATQPRCEIRVRADRRIVSCASQEEIIWQKLRESDVPKKKKEGDLWRPGSPREEAKTLARLIGKNGDAAASVRELIRVNDRELAELREWAACSSPQVAVRIQNMLNFRAAVLSEFNRLVENARGVNSAAAD